MDNQHRLLIKIAETSSSAELYFLARPSADVPQSVALFYYRFMKAFATLWRQKLLLSETRTQ
jgi:hypothetical protein